MSKKKDEKKELVKYVKKLNKLELVDEVEVDGDFDEIKEGFISAIEEIDDDGQIDEVDDKIVNYYESFIEEQPEEEGEEKEEKGSDELEEELNEMNAKELKAFVEENDLDIECKISKKNLEEAVEEVLEAMAGKEEEKEPEEEDEPEEEEEEPKKKDKKGKKGKKDKTGKKGKKDKKKKSKVRGKIPNLLLDAIEDDGATWGELAEIVGEEKDKDPDKCMGIVFRAVSRKVSKVMPIILTMAGDERDAIFSLAW